MENTKLADLDYFLQISKKYFEIFSKEREEDTSLIELEKFNGYSPILLTEHKEEETSKERIIKRLYTPVPIKISNMIISLPPLLFQIGLKSLIPILGNTNPNSLEIIYDSQGTIKNMSLLTSNAQDFLIQKKNLQDGEIYNKIQNYLKELNKKNEDEPQTTEEELEKLFQALHSIVLEKYKIDLGNIRLWPKTFLGNVEEIPSQQEFDEKIRIRKLSHLLDKIVELFYNENTIDDFKKEKEKLSIYDRFYSYPSPLLLSFLQNVKKYYKITVEDLVERLISGLRSRKIAIIITGKLYIRKPKTIQKQRWYLPLRIEFKEEEAYMSYLAFPQSYFTSVNQKEEENDWEWHRKIVQYVRSNYRLKNVFLIEEENIFPYIIDVISSEIPFKSPRASYLFETFLHNYNAFGKKWFLEPKPLLYKGGYRFLLYMNGLRLNLRKLSYWSIPHLVRYIINNMFGLYAKIFYLEKRTEVAALVQGDIKKQFKMNLIEIKEGRPLKINEISEERFREEFELEKHLKALLTAENQRELQDYLNTFYKHLKNSDSEISHILFIKEELYAKILKSLILDLHSNTLRPLKAFRDLIAIIKNPCYLTIYPETPFMKYIHDTSGSKLLKQFAPIITDLNEF